MMSRYLVDIVFIVMAALLAFLLAGMPRDVKAPITSPTPASSGIKTPPEAKAVEVAQKSSKTAIEKRNIFISSGSYKDNAPVPIPDNPYTLLGVVQEKAGMKALFREYTGTVTKASVGHRMIDGFRVAMVQNTQVILKKGQKRKVFNVYGASIPPASGQGDMKNLSAQKILLVGILEGARKKAVLKDSAGNWTILETGQSLPDGSVIVHIDSLFVRLRAGKDVKELMLYAQAFPKDTGQSIQPVPMIQTRPKDAAPRPSVPARRRPNPPHNKAGENDQGGAE